MVVDHLRRNDEQCRTLDDAIACIARGFGRVHIDRFRGEAAEEKHREWHRKSTSSDKVPRANGSNHNDVAWVSLSDTASGEDEVEILLRSRESVFVGYESEGERQRLRPVVEKLAKCLDYECRAWKWFVDVYISFEHDGGIASELNIARMLDQALEKRSIGDFEDIEFSYSSIKLTVTVEDDVIGSERLADMVQELFPDAPFRISIPPHEYPRLP